MSYREIRNLIEHVRALGFSRTVSVENFSTPNFPLVAEILIWAIKTVENENEINSDIDYERDRVLLIRVAVIFFYQTLRIQLNTAKLYGADKLAVRELLKITSSLYKASQTALDLPVDEGGGPMQQENYIVNISGKEIREVRQLASNIVLDAASLHDSLSNEVDGKIQRELTLNRSLDVDGFEATLVSALHALVVTVEEMNEDTEHLVKQEAEIEEKRAKKTDYLVRNCRRLEALYGIKPSWQTEFQQEEAELRSTWEAYIVKHKNVAYLESQLAELEKQQHQQLNSAMLLCKEASSADFIALDSTREQLQNRNRRVLGSMTGENIDSSGDSESVDSFLNDSASDDESLTLLSKEDPLEAIVASGKIVPSTERGGLLSKFSLYPRPSKSGMSKAVQKRPSSARPKSAHSESRVNSHTAWTGSVKRSERVSPLSSSEDNSDVF